MNNVLIIGGSSGLGFELGTQLAPTHHVIVTGRKTPLCNELEFRKLDFTWWDQLPNKITEFVQELPEIEMFVYSAGFYQQGTITDLTEYGIENMIRTGLIAPMTFLQGILLKQKKLKSFVVITSTSQWTPRLNEPVYTATKAALGMFANSISLDERVGKVLVAAPAGMRTDFWRDRPEQETKDMLDPKWVAHQILTHHIDDFEYKFIRILRNNPRVEVAEVR